MLVLGRIVIPSNRQIVQFLLQLELRTLVERAFGRLDRLARAILGMEGAKHVGGRVKEI